MRGSSADAAEIARFERLADQWWNPRGPMRPLHQMNALRVGWIVAHVRRHVPTIEGLDLLDVGCGAGLAAEALAGAGFSVLGIDPSANLVAAARAHAAQAQAKGGCAEGRGLALSYRIGLPEQLLAGSERFEVITALEVIEHVPDQAAFVAALSALLSPGGLLFISTINRTSRSLLLAKFGAEYVLRLLPIGTHDWRRFVRPTEIEQLLGDAGLRVADIAGMSFDPLRRTWRASRDLSINYIVMAAA